MQAGKLGAPQHLVAKLSPAFHDRPEHLVVRAASEENLACIELIQRTANRPYIDREIVR